jgi:hypothetical protein
VEDLVQLAQVIGGHQVPQAGSVPSRDAGGFQRAWEALRTKFAVDLGRGLVDSATWHRQEAEEAENAPERSRLADGAVHLFGKEPDWFAAVFHLDQLLAAEPGSVELYLWRARLNAYLGHWDRVAEDYGRVAELLARNLRLR